MRPSAMASPLKWTQPVIELPLLYSSLPVLASSAFSTAGRVLSIRITVPPACVSFAPVDKPNTIPLAITTGSGRLKSPDIQAGSRIGFWVLGSATTLNDMMLPWGFSPLVIGKCTPVAEGGPHHVVQ